MLAKNYQFSVTESKVIEKIIDDENINLNHMVLTLGTGLPEHHANSNVYMIVIRGVMSIKLDDEEEKLYGPGNIIKIPFKTKMNVNNKHDELLEFFVVKSPNPKDYRGE